jgi:NitT/TauT family transport system ATP-binding protein
VSFKNVGFCAPPTADSNGREILCEINFSTSPGQVLVLYGPNGVGKTTVLNLAAGLISPTSGNVAAPAGPVGFVFQNPASSLLPWLTVAENIALPLRLQGYDASERRGFVEDLVSESRFGPLPLDVAPLSLSGGEQQKVCLLRALASRSSLLLMDEPSAALDVSSKRAFEETVESLRSTDGVAQLMVLHDLDDAILLADRLLLLGGTPGRIIEEAVVELPRPRTERLRLSTAFLEIRSHVIDRTLRSC